MAVNPAGTRVYVTNSSTNTVSVIDTTTNTVTATVVAGSSFPRGVAVNPAGTRLYVAIPAFGNVSVLDTATNAITATLTVGTSPIAFGLFIGPGAAPPPPPPPPPSTIGPIPTLSQWSLLLLGIVLAGLGAAQLQRRAL